MPDGRAESTASTLPTASDEREERRSWRLRAVALALLTAFVLAGLGGCFGVSTSTVSARSPGGLAVRVVYPARARPALAVELRIVVSKAGGFTGRVVVRTSTSYLAAFDENGLNPDPEASTTDGTWTEWSYDRPDADTFTVWLDTRVEPGVEWPQRGTTVVRSGGEEVSVSYRSWIFP